MVYSFVFATDCLKSHLGGKVCGEAGGGAGREVRAGARQGPPPRGAGGAGDSPVTAASGSERRGSELKKQKKYQLSWGVSRKRGGKK